MEYRSPLDFSTKPQTGQKLVHQSNFQPQRFGDGKSTVPDAGKRTAKNFYSRYFQKSAELKTVDKQKKILETDIMRKKVLPPPVTRSPVKKLQLQQPKFSANLVPNLQKHTTMPLTTRARKTKMTLEASPKSRGSVQKLNGQHYLKSPTMPEAKIPRDLGKFKSSSAYGSSSPKVKPASPTQRKAKITSERPSTAWNPSNKQSDVSLKMRAYVPPKIQGSVTKQMPVPTQQPIYAPSAPQLPGQLSKVFESEPRNFPGLMPEFSDAEAFQTAVNGWQKQGILYAADISREGAKYGHNVDFECRVGTNDTQSGYGQLDLQGQLNGIGREVQDFIYEGQFRNNLYHGWGRYIDDVGVFWGTFERGMRHGRGKWLRHKGGCQEGNWNMGAFK